MPFGARATPQETDGKHLYAVRCAHCHEDNDLALKKIPPDLHGVFKRTALPSGAPATDAQVRRVVLAGKGMMPGFAGRFTDEQMNALIANLRRNTLTDRSLGGTENHGFNPGFNESARA